MVNSLTSGLQYVPPTGDFIRFNNDPSYIEKGIEWKLFTERSVKKDLMYKSNGVQEMVKLVGYQEYGNKMQTVIVEFTDGSLACIHPAYLKEMQSSNFGKDLYTMETSISGETVLSNTSNTDVISEDKPKKTTTKVKKASTKPKLALPEDKVHFSAKVLEFTTKMNHFTGEEDEVILFELVKVEGEQELEIGEAWGGYSKTLKKAELAVGDRIEFDGKVIDKRFNKDIRYKINNPSKLKKID